MIKPMENLSKRCCPKCGGTSGLECSFQGVQYYTWDGEVNGYSLNGNEKKYAMCIDCGHRFRIDSLHNREG